MEGIGLVSAPHWCWWLGLEEGWWWDKELTEEEVFACSIELVVHPVLLSAARLICSCSQISLILVSEAN